MPWTIAEWDRSRGVGVISSPDLGDLAFEAAVATVDDFMVGEAVEVALEPMDGSYRVSAIWPDDPRLAPSAMAVREPPALRPDIAVRIGGVVDALPLLVDYRAILDGGDIVLEGDDDQFAYGPSQQIRLVAVEYVELPMSWDGKSMRLASATERRYLGMRVELTPDSVALRIVDAARNIFFVVCRDIERIK